MADQSLEAYLQQQELIEDVKEEILEDLRDDLLEQAIESINKNVDAMRLAGVIGIVGVKSEQDGRLVTIKFEKSDKTVESISLELPEAIIGRNGADGQSGTNATINIGKVSIGDKASVENVGTDEDAILDITIPAPINGKDGVDGIGKEGKQGIPGKPGKDGKDGKDGSSFIWRGKWTNNRTYQKNDVIEYEGSSYIAESENKGKVPSPASIKWGIIAMKGKDGVSAVSFGGGISSIGGDLLTPANYDGGNASSTYGGAIIINGGTS